MSAINERYPELTKLLREFTQHFLIQKPTDAIAFAATYFTNLQNERDRKVDDENLEDSCSSEDEDKVDVEIMTDKEAKRKLQQTSNVPRQSIISERFDPSLIDDETFEINRKIFHKSFEQEEKIAEILKSIFIFNNLDEDQIKKVIESMFPVEVSANEVLIKENDPGDNFYVIDSGEFSAFNEKGTIKLEYLNEGSFGELALLYNCPRAATVMAKSEGYLWAMDRTSFRQLILKSAYNKRKRLENLLKSIPILQELTEYDRCNLADAVKTVVFNNSIIVKQGDMGNKMYFIEEGEASVISTDKEGNEEEVRRLVKGDYFGDVALLAEIPRTASVYAIGTIKVAELDLKSYNRLMGPCLEMMKSNFAKYRDQLEKLLSQEQLEHLFPKLMTSNTPNSENVTDASA